MACGVRGMMRFIVYNVLFCLTVGGHMSSMRRLPFLRLFPSELDLIQWSKSWDLVEKSLTCLECCATQPAIEGAHPFAHKPDCSMKGPYDQYPWRDLIWIVGHTAVDD